MSSLASRPPRPATIFWIAICGVLTALPTLLSSCAITLSFPHKSAYDTFTSVFDYLDLPLNLLLLVCSIGLWGRGRPWVKVWLLRWALLTVAYECVQFLLMVYWIAPKATVSDVGMAEISQLVSQDEVATMIDVEYLIYFISMVSLAAWVWVALRRPRLTWYFEPSDAGSSSSPH
jgi:hypothetical protein